MNEVLRDWYVGDCLAGWVGDAAGTRSSSGTASPDRLRLARSQVSTAASGCTHRSTSIHRDTACRTEEWTRRKHEWLPAPKDREYLLSIQAFAGLRARQVSPITSRPPQGAAVKGQPVNFEYVSYRNLTRPEGRKAGPRPRHGEDGDSGRELVTVSRSSN